VVLFSLAFGMAASGAAPSMSYGAMLLLKEAGGGIALGFAIGYVTYRLLKSLDSYHEEVLITLAAVAGGYALASNLHVSGPLSMVVAGLIVGNHARAEAMSDLTRKNVDMFWELLDAIFNAVLFVLIGLEVIVLSFSAKLLLAGLLVVVVTLGARALTAGLPAALLRKRSGLPQGAGEVLTWGGLRGGISVALALSLPAGREHDIVVSLTYVVVVFSILVQGLSIGRLVQKVVPCSPK
jgi:CPA1 family monovalent cation:H+ antiporter